MHAMKSPFPGMDPYLEPHWLDVQRCPGNAVSLYRVTIRTSGRPRNGYLFPIQLMEPLPEIPVPLRPADLPVKLELQPLLDRVYQNGRYGRTLDYRQPLEPPLDGEDAVRAQTILNARK